MMIVNVLFYVFSAILIGSAVGVITARNPVHAALFLVFAFFNSAILWLLLEAEFLAIVLVLVYVGAVMVLFLFVVMMLDINVEQMRQAFSKYALFGVAVALVVIAEIGSVVWVKRLGYDNIGDVQPLPDGYSNTKALGQLLYSDYVYPFEIAAVILLVAIVAAIILTMRKRSGFKPQDVAAQVAVRSRDRVRIVKMKAEGKEP